jgi:hypothetical protein
MNALTSKGPDGRVEARAVKSVANECASARQIASVGEASVRDDGDVGEDAPCLHFTCTEKYEREEDTCCRGGGVDVTVTS